MPKEDNYLCINTKNCPVYTNWVDQTGKHQINIIQKNSNGVYECLACTAIIKKTVSAGEYLLEKLGGIQPKNINCPTVETLSITLNMLERIVSGKEK